LRRFPGSKEFIGPASFADLVSRPKEAFSEGKFATPKWQLSPLEIDLNECRFGLDFAH
jgi:hypothetical protein